MAMRRRQPPRRKRGHSQTELGHPAQGEENPLDETGSPTSTKTTPAPRAVKRSRAHTILDDDAAGNATAPDPEQPVPQPEDTRCYHTRNPERRPGKHIGLNWEQEQRQQQAEADARAQKKKEKTSQKEARDRAAEHHAQGIKYIAQLEAARELAEETDEHALQASTAHGYHLAAKKAGSLRGCDTGDVEDSGSEFQGDDEEEFDDEEDAEDMVVQKEVSRPKGKAAQRRTQKRVQTREQIDSARPAKAAQSSKPPPADSVVTHAGDAFNNTYRQNLLDRTQGRIDAIVGGYAAKKKSHNREHLSDDELSSYRPQSTPVQPTPRAPAALNIIGLRVRDSPSTPTPSGSRSALALSAPSALGSVHSDNDGEVNQWNFHGGLEEEHGPSIRPLTGDRPRGRPPKTLALVTVQPAPPSKPKGPKRRAGDEMPASKSLSALQLSDDLYVFYEDKLIPTCIDIFGGLKDPWTIKPVAPKNPKTPKPPSLLEVITLLVNQFHEDGEQHVFEETDLIYRVTRQRLINWRNGFLGRACTVVKEGEKAFVGRVKMVTGKNATTADVKAWALAALRSNGGEAWYRVPIGPGNEKARDMFMSNYMLRTFAPHLAVTNQSYLKESKPQLGALALAAAAVEAAFRCYTANGTYQGPEGDFDKVGGGGLTDKWIRGGVTNLHNRRNRWDEMMAAALEMAETRVGRTRTRNIKNVDPYERDVVPHSSSPPRPE